MPRARSCTTSLPWNMLLHEIFLEARVLKTKHTMSIIGLGLP